ncbi:MAG: pilus retraction protein PilT [Myxococcota bacterium]|jgi:pilus retraction protein PilT
MIESSDAIDRYLSAMEKLGASDLFLTEGEAPAARIHGQVRRLNQPATSLEALEALLSRAMLPGARKRFQETGDADVGFSLDSGQRFRLNVARHRGRLSLVARALPSGELSFSELRLPAPVADLASCSRGLVLVTGATGSGKSTSLAALIHHINATRRVHIVTIEDPIEFVHRDRRARITQREVGSDTPDFHSALKHVVRQSPDIILIGEMRDRDTMQVAMSAALTGHLVFASLHTINATQTLQRIMSYYPEHLRGQVAMDLSLSLQGILSQRLLPRAEGDGRVLITELLTGSPAVGQLLRENRIDELEDLMRSSRSPRIYTFNTALLGAWKEGLISHEIAQAYSSNPDEFALMAQGMATGTATFKSQEVVEGHEPPDMRKLLTTTMTRGASDLHLATGRPPILRISGDLSPISGAVLSEADMRMLLHSIMSSRQRTIYELEREVDFSLALSDGQRFRVNAYFQKGQMAAAMRAIPAEIPDPDTLRIPQSVRTLADKPHGLLLVVGPTGSGKSTTMACLIDRINRSRSCRIITIEDPIEYTHRSIMATIDQREVYADTLSFSAALKYILRQDPDVVLVGEMRDLETIQSALTAAETGHLVLATLHTNDAVQSIDRMIDVFPAHQQSQIRSQLAASLQAVVSQRLLSRADGNGRIAAFEVMIGTNAIRNLIRENKMHQALGMMETAKNDGMITMDRALADLLEEELITEADALRYSRSTHTIRQRIGVHRR